MPVSDGCLSGRCLTMLLHYERFIIFHGAAGSASRDHYASATKARVIHYTAALCTYVRTRLRNVTNVIHVRSIRPTFSFSSQRLLDSLSERPNKVIVGSAGDKKWLSLPRSSCVTFPSRISSRCNERDNDNCTLPKRNVKVGGMS